MGWQYINNGVSREDGLHAADQLVEGTRWVEKIIAWIDQFPEEQKSYITGWHAYWGSYADVFDAVEKQVRAKLAKES